MAIWETTEAPWMWWGDDDSLILTVATWAVEVGELSTAPLLLAYFTYPHGYPELFDGWCGSPSN